MPILSIEVGGMFQITEDCFEVGQSFPKGDSKPSVNSYSKTTSTPPHPPSSLSPSIAIKGKGTGRTEGGLGEGEENSSGLYEMRIVFERPAQFVCLSLESFKSAVKSLSLDDNKGTVHRYYRYC